MNKLICILFIPLLKAGNEFYSLTVSNSDYYNEYSGTFLHIHIDKGVPRGGI